MIKVRFAPSPTGFLHVGGARTALYNWLFARKNKGVFLLRIEDTDRTRYVPNSVEDIMESLKWLGLSWDEGPVFQSQRTEIYRKLAHKLVEEGKAYKCFCSPERLKALREEQRKMGLKPGYDRKCRNLTEDEVKELEKQGKKYVIRLKVPLSGETTFYDEIHGKITVKNTELEDIILLKSDGYPTYHLANVIDDHMMGITHVMRADEWIPSTPYHIILYRAFGFEPPRFAHLPVILAPSGKGKLSKRHGATSVREFKKLGILPEALINYLALLGWSPGNDIEIMSLDEMVNLFDLKKIGKRGSVFDYKKLYWMNAVYIRKKSDDELFKLALPYFKESGLVKNKETEDLLRKIIPLFKERIKTLSEFPPFSEYFFKDDFPYEEKGIRKYFKSEEVFTLLDSIKEELAKLQNFNVDGIEQVIRGFAEKNDIKPSKIIHPIRVALTGKTIGPGLFELMEVLGKEKVIQRLSEIKEKIKIE